MNRSVKECFAISWQRMKTLLFPFNLRKWLKIFVIAFLAGSLLQFFGSGNRGAKQKAVSDQTATQTQGEAVREDAGNSALSGQTASGPEINPNQPALSLAERIVSGIKKRIPPFVFQYALLLGSLGALIYFVFMWTASVFCFLFLDLLIKGNRSIRQGFVRYRPLGTSLFRWSFMVTVIPLAIGGLLMVVWMKVSGLHSAGFVRTVLLISSVILWALFWCVGLMTTLVTPLMYGEHLPILQAWKRFLSPGLSWKQGILYFLIRIPVWIVGYMINVIGWLVVGILMLIIMALIGVVLLFAAKWIGAGVLAKALIPWYVFLNLSVIFVGMGLVSLPVSIYLGYFMLAWYPRIVPGYDLLKPQEFDLGGVTGGAMLN